jgi:hypothetical protein
MRFWLAAVVLIPAPLARAGGSSPEAALKGTVQVFREARTLLGAVKDRKTAEAARPKLLALGKRLDRLREKDPGEPKDPEAKRRLEALAKKYRLQLKGILNGLTAEVGRIGLVPDAAAVLRDVPLLKPTFNLEKARIDRAKAGVKVLTQALEAYAILNKGAYPASLESLTKAQDGQKALLSADKLVDPWGQPYGYEAKTLDPATGRPLVYSRGPAPDHPASRIRNWTAPKDKKK